MQKQCNKCCETKPVASFNSDSSKPDRLQSYCRDCKKIAMAVYRVEKKESLNQASRQYKQENKQRIAAYNLVYRTENKDLIAAQRSTSGASAKYIRANPHRVSAGGRERRAAQKRATPPWADMAKIKAIYLDAQGLSEKTGIKHHVDHIIPLRGKMVCGLHSHNNLQAITALANLKKGDR